MRKVLLSALILAVALGAGTLAFAGTIHAGAIAPPAFRDIAGHEAEGALTLLAAIGAYTGESGLGGPVHPDDPVTRAQFCKVVVIAMGWGSTARSLAGLQPIFIDGASIPTWAWGYVNVALYRGIINGYADGTFGPGRLVSFTEAIAMLIRAVGGHDRQVKAGPGSWPYNYMFYGVDNGFAGDVDLGFAALPASRGDLARMLMATMQIDKLNKDGGKIAASAVLAGHVFEGVVKSYGPGTIEVGATNLPLAELVYLVGADGYEGLRNLKVMAVTNGDEDCLFIQVLEDSNIIAGVFKELGDVDGDHHHDCLVLADGTKVPYAEDDDGDDDMVEVTINQATTGHEGNLAAGDECLVILGDHDLAVYVNALRFQAADWVEDFKPADAAAHPAKDTWLHLYHAGELTVPATCQVTVNGARAGRDDLKVYDCVYVAKTGETPIAIRAIRQTVRGTVYGTSISYPGEIHRVTIDKTGGGRETYVLDLTGGVSEPSEGDTVKYGLNKAGAVYVPIGYTTLTPYVVVKAFTMEGSGHRTATFNIRGVPTVYRLGPDAEHPSINLADEAEAQAYGWIKVSAGTGVVSEWEEHTLDDLFEVLATDPVHGSLTLRYHDEGGYHYAFIDDPSAVVYKVATSGDKVYIGIAGVKAGDWLLGDNGPDSVMFELTDEPD